MKRYEKEIRDLLEQLDGFVPEGSENKKKGNAAPPDELFAQAARREREQREADRQNMTLHGSESDNRNRSRPSDAQRPIPFPTSRHPTLLQRIRTIPFGVTITVGPVILGIIGIALMQANLTVLGQVIIGVAVVLFLLPTIAGLIIRNRTSNVGYWRGQSVSVNHPSAWSSTRAWFRRTFRRNRPGIDERSRSNFPNDDPWNKRRY